MAEATARTTTEERREAKRSRILDAAVIEIARHGYYETTVSRISRRAGVADGTIYLYFESKEQILVSIFERAMQRFIHDGRTDVESHAGAEAKLEALVRFHLAALGGDRDLAVIFQVELRHSLHFLELFSRSWMREYMEVIAGIVTEGQTEGVFRPDVNPLFAAKALFGVLDEMATDWVLSKRNTRLEARNQSVVDLVLRGLRAS